jgi:transketolase
MEAFFEQEQTYRDHVLPDHTYKVTIEAAHSMPWWKIIGNHGHAISIDEFGASAPASDLFKKYNITTDEVVNSVLANIGD